MYKLYYSPFSCSLAVHIALEKTGEAFQLEKIDVRKGVHQTEDYLKLNRHGKVPLLQDGDQFIDQGAGILLYLADKHPDATMLPQAGDSKRAEAISTLFYMSNTVHPTLAMAFYPDRFTSGEPDGVFNKAIEKTKQLLSELDDQVASQGFLNDSKPYVADYYLVTMLNWLQLFKITLDDYPHLTNFKQKMGDFPEVSRAIGKEIREF